MACYNPFAVKEAFVMISIKKTVGENLRSVCRVKGIKNKDIADHVGVSESCVSNWLRGKNSFDVDNLYSICQFLNVSVDQIFGIAPIVYGVLKPEENDILIAYRKADSGTKSSVLKLLDIPEKKSAASEPSAI